MKKFFILLIFSFLFFTGCKKEECGEGCYAWGGGYNATIGFDFDSALDSLLIIEYTNRSYNGTPYYLEPELMRGVVYPYDERDFYMIKVMDNITQYILASNVNVLDTKGDWYYSVWPEDLFFLRVEDKKKATRTIDSIALVPHAGVEPAIYCVRGSCPGPLDECGSYCSEIGCKSTTIFQIAKLFLKKNFKKELIA